MNLSLFMTSSMSQILPGHYYNSISVSMYRKDCSFIFANDWYQTSSSFNRWRFSTLYSPGHGSPLYFILVWHQSPVTCIIAWINFSSTMRICGNIKFLSINCTYEKFNWFWLCEILVNDIQFTKFTKILPARILCHTINQRYQSIHIFH